MMKVLGSPYFISCLILYLLVQAGHFFDLEMGGFIKNHLADLLCLPIVFCLILVMVQNLPQFKADEKRRMQTKLPVASLFVITVFWAVYFEWYLPTQNSIHTADPLDVMMYFVGAFSYFFWQRSYFLKLQEA